MKDILKERTKKEEHLKDVRLCLWQIQKDIRLLADDIFCLYQVLDEEETNNE